MRDMRPPIRFTAIIIAFTIIIAFSIIIAFAPAAADELIFFADDHYKVLGEPQLRASALNPVIEPGKNATISVMLANSGRVEELIPISGNGSEADIFLEIEEEQNCVDAQNITVRLFGDEYISVTSPPCLIDSLPSGSVARMEFDLSADEADAAGRHDLLLSLDYEHQMDVSVLDGIASPLYMADNASQMLGVMVRGPGAPIEILRVKSEMPQGGSGLIEAAVKNSGAEVLRNCTLRLIALPPLRSAGGNCNLGSLMPGEVALAKFPVEVNGAADGEKANQEYSLACEATHEGGKNVISFPVTLEKGSVLRSTHLLLIVSALAAAAFGAVILFVRSRRTRTLRGRRLWR